jgi:hypothetical protein
MTGYPLFWISVCNLVKLTGPDHEHGINLWGCVYEGFRDGKNIGVRATLTHSA